MVGGNRPCLSVVSQTELSHLVHNHIFLTFIIIWQDISESEAIIEDAEDDLHRASCLLLIVDCQLVVVVAYAFVLTPELLPGLIFRRTAYSPHPRMGSCLTISEKKTQTRGTDNLFTMETNLVECLFGLHTDSYLHGSVG